jgi:hypothetical protein
VTKATAYFRFRVSPVVAQYPPAMLRFHSPLIEPDRRSYRIRLSDKDDAIPVVSRLGTRKPRDSESFFAVACNALHNAWASSGGRLSPMARPLVASSVVLELRPLRSAGVTRFHHYYGPLRHLPQPGLSLTGVQLAVTRRHRGRFPVLRWFPLANMPSPLPRWTCGDYRSPGSHSGGLPRYAAGSASTLCFSRPAQRSLRLWPACSRNRLKRSFPSKAPTVSSPPPPLRLLPAGATSCRVGFEPTENQHLSQRT